MDASPGIRQKEAKPIFFLTFGLLNILDNFDPFGPELKNKKHFKQLAITRKTHVINFFIFLPPSQRPSLLATSQWPSSVS